MIATIPNGSNISGVINLDSNQVSLECMFSLFIPTIDAATIYIQASMDGVNFSRVLKTDGSGDWNIATSTGNRFIFLDQFAPFKFLKVETSVNQTADRQFNFLSYRREDPRFHA